MNGADSINTYMMSFQLAVIYLRIALAFSYFGSFNSFILGWKGRCSPSSSPQRHLVRELSSPGSAQGLASFINLLSSPQRPAALPYEGE